MFELGGEGFAPQYECLGFTDAVVVAHERNKRIAIVRQSAKRYVKNNTMALGSETRHYLFPRTGFFCAGVFDLRLCVRTFSFKTSKYITRTGGLE